MNERFTNLTQPNSSWQSLLLILEWVIWEDINFYYNDDPLTILNRWEVATKDVAAVPSNQEHQEDLSRVASEDLKTNNNLWEEEDPWEIKVTDNCHPSDRSQESENKFNFQSLKLAANLKSETSMRNKSQTMTWRYESKCVINQSQ